MRAQLLKRIYDVIKYTSSLPTCLTCSNSDKDSWVDGKGKCGIIARLKFPIIDNGVCKYHSDLNGGSVKRDVLFM